MISLNNISIALVLPSNKNNSTERAINETAYYLNSFGVKVSLFIADIPYFHSYWFNLISLLNLNPRIFYSNFFLCKIGYFFIRLYLKLKPKREGTIDFSVNPIYYPAYKRLDLTKFNYVITHNAYLIPFIKTKNPLFITLNADYLHQKNVSINPAWWSFCFELISTYKVFLFTNSDELTAKYRSLGLFINGIAPDGPSYESIDFTINRERKLLLIYGHGSLDKGFNCLDSESIAYLESLGGENISIIGAGNIIARSERFHNYGKLPYLQYLSKFSEYKIFLYLSRSDGFESPPIDALLSGCFVISSKTPGALYYSQITKRIILLDDISKENIKTAVAQAIKNFSELNSLEFMMLKEHASKHSARQGATNYLNFISVNH